MRGGFLHNQVLLAPIEAYFRQVGAAVYPEHPVPGAWGAVDLFVEYRHHRVAVEAELTPRRVQRDIEKARALNASVLLIVMPTNSLASQAKARLVGAVRVPGMRIVIRPLGPALAWVERSFPMISDAIPTWKTDQKGES